MFEHIAATAAGYLFSVVAGYWAIAPLMDTAWRRVVAPLTPNPSLRPNPYPEHPQAIGILERCLYTASWQLGVKEFVGVWLLLKVAGGWNGWASDLPFGTGKIPGRTLFSVFLIGTGVSLAYGVAGGLVIQWLDKDSWALALLLAASVVGATFALRWFLSRESHAAG